VIHTDGVSYLGVGAVTSLNEWARAQEHGKDNQIWAERQSGYRAAGLAGGCSMSGRSSEMVPPQPVAQAPL
jgi:hypothetical protein